MNNWRDFDLNTEEGRRSIERWMAEQIGYRIYHYTKGIPEYYCLMDETYDSAVVQNFHLKQYESVKAGWHMGERATEAEAWADVPQWAEDMRAFEDLIDDQTNYATHRNAQGWTATLYGVEQLLFQYADAPRYEFQASAGAAAWCERRELEARESRG